MTGEKQTDSLNRLREIVLHNFWLKVISLLMAFTLWYYVTGGPRREETISVPLDLHVPDAVMPLRADKPAEGVVAESDREERGANHEDASTSPQGGRPCLTVAKRVTIDGHHCAPSASQPRISHGSTPSRLRLPAQSSTIRTGVNSMSGIRSSRNRRKTRCDTRSSPRAKYPFTSNADTPTHSHISAKSGMLDSPSWLLR